MPEGRHMTSGFWFTRLVATSSAVVLASRHRQIDNAEHLNQHPPAAWPLLFAPQAAIGPVLLRSRG
eukprot:1160736-Pelagomonas_calceolata.AAC.3